MRSYWRFTGRLLLSICLAWGAGAIPAQAEDTMALGYPADQHWSQQAAPWRPTAAGSHAFGPQLSQRLAAAPKLEAPRTDDAKPEPIPTPAPEPPDSGLTLDQLQQMALECNPTLVQAAMNVRVAEGAHVQAGLYPNPVVGYVGDEIGNEGSAGFQGGFVAQQIVTAGKLRLGRAVTGHGIERTRYLGEVQRMRVLNDVRAQFCTVLLSQRVIDINRQLVEISEKNLDATRQLRKAQEVGEPEVLQSEIEAETARVALAAAQNQHWSAWRQLAAVVGRPEMEPVKLLGSSEDLMPLLSWEEINRQVLTQSPMLAQARAKVEQARCELARQCALRVPNIDVESAVKYDASSDYTVADLRVGVPLPIYNRNQGNILRAQAQLITAEKEVQRLELVLQRQLSEVYEQYLTAHQQAEAYVKRILPNASKSLDLIQKGYRQGEVSYLALLTSQRTYFTTHLTYLTNLQAVVTRRVLLDGLLIQGGLEEIMPGEGPLE